MNFSTLTSEVRSSKSKQYYYLMAVMSSFLASLLIYLAMMTDQMGKRTLLSHYYESIENFKLGLLQTMGSKPKILIIAGSSADLGVRAVEIQKATGIPTLNLGLVASIRLSYFLSLAEKNLKSGDILILPLEYHYYVFNDSNNVYTTDFILGSRSQFLKDLPLIEQINFLLSSPLSQPIKSWSYSQSQYSNAQYSSGFNPNERNHNGDFILNSRDRMTDHERQLLVRMKPFHFLEAYPDGFTPKSAAWLRLSKFIDWCRTNHVKLIAAYPPFVYFEDYRSPRDKVFFDSITSFYRQHGVPVLGDPYDFMYDRSFFADSRYHLLAETAMIHTRKLIALLNQELHLKLSGKQSGSNAGSRILRHPRSPDQPSFDRALRLASCRK